MGRNDSAQWIASLNFPTQAAKVLAQDRFWTIDCLGHYLHAASEFCQRQPGEGRHVSQIGLQLAQFLPRSARRQQLLVRALALHAWSHQACGAFAEAHGIYRTALQLAQHIELEPWIEGDLMRRYASFLRQHAATHGAGPDSALDTALDAALDAADRAVALLREPSAEAEFVDWRLDLGRALVERALVSHGLREVDDVVTNLGLAMESFDPSRHESEIGRCLDLLAEIASDSTTLDRLHRIARRVAVLRDRMAERTDGSYLAARVLQLDAELFRRMGALQRAERSLRQARRLLRKLPERTEYDDAFLAVSLDLAMLLVREERHDELLRLSADSLDRVGDRGLSLTRYRWRRAMTAGRLDADELERIQTALHEERRIVPADAGTTQQHGTEAIDRPTAVGE